MNLNQTMIVKFRKEDHHFKWIWNKCMRGCVRQSKGIDEKKPNGKRKRGTNEVQAGKLLHQTVMVTIFLVFSTLIGFSSFSSGCV